MRLQRARVRNYRSIVDSGEVDIEDRVTVLIGKNEQGKTTFLKGLASLNPNVVYTPNDMTNHLRAALEQRDKKQIEMVDAWLELEPPDNVKLKELVPDAAKISAIHVTKYYDSHYSYSAVPSESPEFLLEPKPTDIQPLVKEMATQAEVLRSKLQAHATRLATFAPSLDQAAKHIDALLAANFSDAEHLANVVKTFGTALKAVPGQDAPIQEDVAQAIASVVKTQSSLLESLNRDPFAGFRAALPRFILHSATLDKIPDFVSVPDFVANPEGVSKGMANLCAVAGLSTQKIRELASTPDAADRATFEDTYRSSISGGINQFWTQERYDVHFRIEETRLSLHISDDTYSPRIRPSDRSDGFQWYLSFYSALSSEVSSSDPIVLLLDNPGLELHADGQRDIKRFLEEKLPQSAQVIYVTHSTAMLDPFNFEQVRQVELLPHNHGTKVGKLRSKGADDFDLVEPARSVIGACLGSSLILNELNILVEGAADKPILEGAIRQFRAQDTERILVNGSVAESSGFLPKFYKRARLPLAVFLDADDGGRALKAQLTGWGISEDQIVDLRSLFKDSVADFELEDILSQDFYHAAINAAYPIQAVDPPPAEFQGKRTNHYKREFKERHGIGFSKRRVAENVKRLLGEGRADDPTLKNLRTVTDAIWAALERQIRPSVSETAATP